MNVRIEETWKNKLQNEFGKDYFIQLTEFVKNAYQTKKIFPPASLIFNAFDTTPFDKVKVVILGQDPYHGDGQANGLAFSVNKGIKIPPSLVNIYKEIDNEFGETKHASGDLTDWANQGVLLLNATLTVEAHEAGSHQKKGWETFTDEAIKKLAEDRENIVFLLWGNYAQQKTKYIDPNKHLILKSVHPSPLSAHRGFLGCDHFKTANEYLTKHGQNPINW